MKTANSETKVLMLIQALSKSKSGRLEVIKAAYKKGLINDYRLYPLFSKALGDKYSEIVNLVYEEIIPSIGKPMVAYLAEDYDCKGGKADARRLSLLYKLEYIACSAKA